MLKKYVSCHVIIQIPVILTETGTACLEIF